MLTEAEAHRIIIGSWLLESKGDLEGVGYIGASLGDVEVIEVITLLRAALVAGFQAYRTLAEMTDSDLVELLESLAMRAAMRGEGDDDE